MNRCSITAVCTVILFVAPSPLLATEELERRLKEAAVEVLAKINNQSIEVGSISPTSPADAISAPGIALLLQHELDALTAPGAPGSAPFELKGDYGLIKSQQEPELRAIKLTLRIIDRESAEERRDLRTTIHLTGTNTIAQLLSSTVSLPPDGSKVERQQALLEGMKQPAVHIEEAIISASKGSPYSIELLALSSGAAAPESGSPISARNRDGQAHITLSKRGRVALKLYNNSDKEVAAKVLANGLNVLRYPAENAGRVSERAAEFIVPAHGTVTVDGWQKADAEVVAFGPDFGVPDPVELHRVAATGGIQIQFASCSPAADGARSTDVSRPVKSKARASLQRYAIDPPSEFITVRYKVD